MLIVEHYLIVYARKEWVRTNLKKLDIVDISVVNIEQMVPLSNYNHWVRMGNECLQEAHRFDLLIKKYQGDGNIADLVSLRNRYLETAEFYYKRAEAYRRQ